MDNGSIYTEAESAAMRAAGAGWQMTGLTLLVLMAIAGTGWALYLFDTSSAMVACPVLGVSAVLLLVFGGLVAKLSQHDMHRLWEVAGGTVLLVLGLAGVVYGLFYKGPKEAISALAIVLGVVATLGGIALLISKKADRSSNDGPPTDSAGT